MSYHMLYIRQAGETSMAAEFGDYDKASVLDERQDYLDHGTKAGNMRVVRFASAQDVPSVLGA